MNWRAVRYVAAYWVGFAALGGLIIYAPRFFVGGGVALGVWAITFGLYNAFDADFPNE